MRVLVTGAGGFVGAAVVRAAAAAGLEVVAALRAGGQRARLAGLGARLVDLDLRDREAVAQVVGAARPEAIVHSAWGGVSRHAQAELAQLTENVAATHHLLEAAEAAGVSTFVGIGSQAEYGLLRARVSEDHLPAPVTFYGTAKLAALHMARVRADRAGMRFAWLRLFAAYGPGDNPGWLIPSLIRSMADGTRPLLTSGAQLWDYLYIDDAAAAVLAVVRTPEAAGVFNLGSGTAVPVRRVVEMIRDRVAPGLELVFGEVPHGPTQVWHLEADITRLQRATGWAPRTGLDAGLDRTVAAFGPVASAPA